MNITIQNSITGCKSIIKLLLAAGMAIVIPVSCGSGDDLPQSVPTPTPTVDPNAPTVTLLVTSVNVFGGVKVEIANGQLLIDGKAVASWSAGHGSVKEVVISLNGKTIHSGTIISESGTLHISVTNDAGKTFSTDLMLTDEVISGFSILKQVLQVDKEIDLMESLTIAQGFELTKVEFVFEGQRTEIADPHHFTPEYPGSCTFIFTIKKDGTASEVTTEELTIKPMQYTEMAIVMADMIEELYPWYNNLQQSTKDFIYPHLQASYAACNWSKLDNRVHIIQGETTNASDVENIGQWNDRSDHAYQGYYRIRALSPDISIKGCDDYWNNLEEYINHHPDKIYIISCAAGSAGGRDREEYNRNPETSSQKSLLENENVIIICSGGNWRQAGRKTYNESIKNGDYYNASATNSKKNNKITVTGYNSWGGDNYFSPRYSVYGGLRSAMPVGYDKDKGNIVMPMVPLISSHNNEDQNTTSSCPTAVVSGVIGNAISVIMSNHPGITAEDAMTIICDNYLREETFQYMDETTNGQLVDGGQWYFIEMQQLLEHELLLSGQLNNLLFNADEVKLPSGPGLCYTGTGILFEYEGKKYLTTAENSHILTEALKSGNVKWYWSRSFFRKCGGENTATFSAYIVDKQGKRIPDLHKDVRIQVTR